MGFLKGVSETLQYQIKRRTDNPISSAISVSLFFLFTFAHRHLFQTYWPSFITKYPHSKQVIYVTIIVGLSLLMNLVYFTFYGVIDWFDLMPQHKIVKTNLPWETDPVEWRKLRSRSIKLNLFNTVLIGFAGTILDSFFLEESFMAPEIPSVRKMLSQMVFCMLVESVLFYYCHKMGHLYFYKYHKVHHEFKCTTSLAGSHTHPIDFFLGSVLPFAIGPKILIYLGNYHISSLMFWGVFRLSEGHDAHSNYDIPWSPCRAFLFSTTAESHSFHHTHNQGNYSSSYTLPEAFYSDNQWFLEHKKNQALEQQKQQKIQDKKVQ